MRALLAVDLAERPERVVELARPWVERAGATLDLAYVDPLAEFEAWFNDPALRARLVEEVHKQKERSAANLRALLEALPPDRRGEIAVLSGDPASTLAELGRDRDLIVVVTHGRTGLAHLWLGSTAERLIRMSSVPVLVLRAA